MLLQVSGDLGPARHGAWRLDGGRRCQYTPWMLEFDRKESSRVVWIATELYDAKPDGVSVNPRLGKSLMHRESK